MWYLSGSSLVATGAVRFYVYLNGPDAVYSYCSNSQYSFTYSKDFVYTNPHCEALHEYEITQKLPSSAFIATVYSYLNDTGWPCGADDAAALADDCTSSGGTTATLFGSQCTCTRRHTAFPIGVESMAMAFDHAYTTSRQVVDCF